MPNVPISSFANAGALNTGDVMLINTSANTRKVSLLELGNFLATGTGLASVATGVTISGGPLIGDVLISGTFNMAGPATITQNLRASGNLVLGTLNSSVKISGSGIEVHGNLRVFGNITGNNVEVKNNLAVSGNTTLGIGVNNTTTILGRLTAQSGLNVTGPVSISSNTHVTSGVNVGTNVSVTGTLSITGSTILGNSQAALVTTKGTITSHQSGHFYRDVIVGNQATISGELNVSGNSSFGTASTDTLTSRAKVFVRNDLIVTGDLNILGQATFSGGLNISGTITYTNLTVNSGLTVRGDTQLGDAQTDLTKVSGNLLVTNNFTTPGNAYIGGVLYVTGFISGNKYDSGLTAITPNGLIINTTHGLGGLPNNINAFLYCTASGTGNLGYHSGDYVRAESNQKWSCQAGFNNTGIFFLSSGTPQILNKNGTGLFAITASDWRFRVYGWLG